MQIRSRNIWPKSNSSPGGFEKITRRINRINRDWKKLGICFYCDFFRETADCVFNKGMQFMPNPVSALVWPWREKEAAKAAPKKAAPEASSVLIQTAVMTLIGAA